MADDRTPDPGTKVDAEPGHRIAEARADHVSDFNAARRAKEQGPFAVGLQDSEAIAPAPWPHNLDEVARVQVERAARRLEAQAKELRDSLKDSKSDAPKASAK